jgi:molybdate transport system regulatory protein
MNKAPYLTDISYRMSVRLFSDGDKCFGPGLLELLEKVGETSSLSAAAKEMNMAYSKAWRIVNDAESALKYKLLNTSIGGKSGGGAILTDEAKTLIADYRVFMAALKNDADRRFAEYFY